VTPALRTPLRIGFVLHVMQVAGAEVLVAETIRRLGTAIDPVVLCLDGVGQLGERLVSEGIPVLALRRRPGLDFRVALRLAHEIDRRGLEVIHAHQYTPFFYTALARLISRRSVHVMFTEHGRHYPDVVSWPRRLANRLLLSRLADEINGVCQFSARSLAEVDGFGARQIEVITNGIDVARYSKPADRLGIRSQLGIDPRRRIVMCIARFHPVKDHATLLRAFAGAAATRPDIDLVLAGDGALRSDLESLAVNLGIASRTRFLGVRRDVPELLQAADVFALTSLSEAASLTLLEAMAAALPVVVTDVGGNAEIVEHGVQGYLVGRSDAAAASTALAWLLDNPEAACSMGRAGQRRVHDCFRLEHTLDRYHERYCAAVRRLRGLAGEAAVA
jgi:L-malate glycosyltransferase